MFKPHVIRVCETTQIPVLGNWCVSVQEHHGVILHFWWFFSSCLGVFVSFFIVDHPLGHMQKPPSTVHVLLH